MALEISPTSGDLVEWLGDDDLPEELSGYLICCAATVRGAAGGGEKPDPKDLLIAAQRGWLGELRSAQRRWSLSLASEAQAASAARQRLADLEDEHRVATRRHRQEVERLLEAARSRLELEKQGLEEAISKIQLEARTAEARHRQEVGQLRLEYRVALVAARAATRHSSPAAGARAAEVDARVEHLARRLEAQTRSLHATRMEVDAIKETRGYRILCRLRRWRHRLLFLSATHELRPTVNSLLEAAFCWPWRLLLPPSTRSVLDARIEDPPVFHDSLRVHTASPEPWLDKGYDAVDTRPAAPRTDQGVAHRDRAR